MLLELKQIFQNDGARLEINTDFDWSELEMGGIKPFIGPVSVKGEVFNHTGLVSLVMNVTFVYSAPCDRCGVSKDTDYCMKFEHLLVSALEGEDEGEYLVLDGYSLDLDELVFSDVILDLPAKHLCNENCKGLCPQCGANLNLTECSCQEEDIDPRLAVLKRLLEED